MKGLRVLETAGLLALVIPPMGMRRLVETPAPARAPAPAPTPAPVPPRLSVPQAVWLNGAPFPRVAASPRLPTARRTFFAASGSASGDGSEARPWTDLQEALRRLEPGDRLQVKEGDYSVSLRIDESCRDGTRTDPIQVVFDGKAELKPQEDSAVLTVTRAHWLIARLYANLSNSKASAVSLEGAGAHDVTLLQVRISGGRGAGSRIGAATDHVTIAGARISKERVSQPELDSVGIRIEAGARNVLLRNNHLHENPAGSIRIEAPLPGGRRAADIRIVGNTISSDGSTAIAAGAADGLRVADNTISDATGGETRCLTLDQVSHVTVRSNHFSHCAVAIRVGQVDPDQGVRSRPDDVSIDHNFLETSLPGATAVDIEAGERVRFANNVIQGYADGIVVFGRPPSTGSVTVANNLVLEVSGTALLLQDPKAAVLFDYNVFSPRGDALTAVVGRKATPLSQFLKGGTMPHTRVVPNVQIQNRDLARITGVETAHQGRAIDGTGYRGSSAPDLGVAEK
jgi:hypothetical protein